MGTQPDERSCLSDELLGARAAEQLPAAERSNADAHLATCESCRVVLAELMRAGARPPAAKLGRYVLEEILGSGGMGTVWCAWDPELDRRVAVKLLHEARAGDPGRAQRFSGKLLGETENELEEAKAGQAACEQALKR